MKHLWKFVSPERWANFTAPKCLIHWTSTHISLNICREPGVTHYANAGLTNCCPGTDIEERISREHPERRETVLKAVKGLKKRELLAEFFFRTRGV